ncbi:MAG: PBP1A family penicillin-binding protein [bacterium]
MPISQLKRREKRQYGLVSHDTHAQTRSVRKKTKKIKMKKTSWLKNLVMFFILIGCLGLIAGTITVAMITKDLPSPDKLTERTIAQSTKIYDRTGEHLLYEIYQNQKRTLVELNQIAEYAQQATVAVEDKNFYTHKGIRLQSIARAAFNNLIGRRVGGGGASTLTQQLIKNAVVGDERTIFRKIKEAIMAIRLERKYDKNQILKMYLNEIPYGSTNYGIEAASQSYFKKSAKDLNLSESATLAALPQASTRYLNDISALTERRDVVLELMYNQGYITEQEKNTAQNTPVSIYQKTNALEAPHFILYVKQLLADSFGEKTVDEGGLKVITTLDYDKQKIAEKAVKEIGDINNKEKDANNAALVAMDPKTGEVLAMVGSRDFEDEKIDGKYNVAVLGKRQPGSSFKPFIYLKAFEKGYTPETVLYDVETDFEKNKSEKEYIPKNYTGKEYGLVTLRQALQGSLNIAAVKTLYLVGVQEMIKFATEKLGYTALTGDYGLSLVLGGAEITLLEHTAAYATLANQGIYHKPITILKVENYEGQEIYKAKESKGDEAIDKDLVSILSNVLSDDQARSYIFGANSKLTLPGRPVAAKTGTTDDTKDAWTMGYIPSLVAGVWVGNTKPSPMKGGGSDLAAPIWNQFMRESLQDIPVEQFPELPEKKEIKNPILRGQSGGITLGINRKTGKIAVSTTPKELVAEKKFLLPHTILHYLDKDDPTKPDSNSINDPQYEIWEKALQVWIGKQKNLGDHVSLQDPPTEYDDPQNLALIPSLEIISPTASSTIVDRKINFQVKASSPRGVAEVDYYVDEIKVASSREHPFTTKYNAKILEKGWHTIKVIAEDDQGNMAIEEIKINLQADFDPPGFEWLDNSTLSLKKEDFPRVLFINTYRWEDTDNIKIYLISNNKESLIYTFDKTEKITGNKLMFIWNKYPGTGDYMLKGIIVDKFGSWAERKINIHVK